MTDVKLDRPVQARAGNLYLRLAETTEEMVAAQELRYRVFYEGMAATPTREMAALRRDFDSFDPYCEHLIVFDTGRGTGPGTVIGTYRVMRREAARRRGQFYSAGEYDIGRLLEYRGEILELGRSCIDEGYRGGAAMQLLWRGIAEYVLAHNIDLMFGCASLPGVNPDEMALPLAFLHHHHLAPLALRPRALPHRYVAMDRMPAESVPPATLQILPPLLKGYLRLGGFVGDGAVVDREFGTTDVCVVVNGKWVRERYLQHFTRGGSGKT